MPIWSEVDLAEHFLGRLSCTSRKGFEAPGSELLVKKASESLREKNGPIGKARKCSRAKLSASGLRSATKFWCGIGHGKRHGLHVGMVFNLLA